MRRRARRWMWCFLAGFLALTFVMPVDAKAEPPLTPAPGCIKREWPATVMCGGTACFVSSCGEGKCPYCFIKGLENVAIKGWAVYTCMTGESVTGKAILFLTKPFSVRLGPYCG